MSKLVWKKVRKLGDGVRKSDQDLSVGRGCGTKGSVALSVNTLPKQCQQAGHPILSTSAGPKTNQVAGLWRELSRHG